MPFVKLEQIGGNSENFTYSIVNNGIEADSILTLHGTTSPHSYRIIIDFTEFTYNVT